MSLSTASAHVSRINHPPLKVNVTLAKTLTSLKTLWYVLLKALVESTKIELHSGGVLSFAQDSAVAQGPEYVGRTLVISSPQVSSIVMFVITAFTANANASTNPRVDKMGVLGLKGLLKSIACQSPQRRCAGTGTTNGRSKCLTVGKALAFML